MPRMECSDASLTTTISALLSTRLSVHCTKIAQHETEGTDPFRVTTAGHLPVRVLFTRLGGALQRSVFEKPRGAGGLRVHFAINRHAVWRPWRRSGVRVVTAATSFPIVKTAKAA